VQRFTTHGEQKHACRIFVEKLEVKRPLGRPRHRWVDTIEIDHVEIELGVMD
jgi:hypothetical protein